LVGDQVQDPALQLAGIEVHLNVAPFGEITRLWDVPQSLVANSVPAP
jgi:hypothetical protein